MSEQEQEPEGSPVSIAFGRHVRSLRRARGLTQDRLAASSGIAVDSVRRIEQGRFAPSLTTLVGLCRGLGLRMSTLFEAFEVGERDEQAELIDLVAGRSRRQLEMAIRILRDIFEEIDGAKEADDGP